MTSLSCLQPYAILREYWHLCGLSYLLITFKAKNSKQIKITCLISNILLHIIILWYKKFWWIPSIKSRILFDWHNPPKLRRNDPICCYWFLCFVFVLFSNHVYVPVFYLLWNQNNLLFWWMVYETTFCIDEYDSKLSLQHLLWHASEIVSQK